MDFCNLRKIIFTKNYLRLNLLPLQRLHSLEFPPGSVENEITNICVLTVALLPVLIVFSESKLVCKVQDEICAYILITIILL